MPGARLWLPPGEEAIGSFGGGAPGEAKRVSEFRFNFRYETWERVLQMFADGAGLTLDLNQIPPGTFSHYDDNAYTARQTLDILNGYLNRKGYAMIENDGFLIVMNTDKGVPPYLIRDVTEEELLKVGKELEVGDNELANYQISVEGMDTAKVAQEVEAVLGPLGSLVALTDSQLLIITDVGANLRRIHSLLTAAMSKSKPDALIFKAYHLRNMDAEEAELAVMIQFGMRQNVANVSVGVEEASRSRSRGGFPPAQTPTPAPAVNKAEPTIQIASDLRLNSLLVTGTAKQHELVDTILTALDVSESPTGESLSRTGRKGTYLEVYQVKTADAGEVTKTLGAMNIPGVQVVNEDRRTGRIHIMATERQHEEVAMLVRQLDGAGTSGSVAVIPLAQMDPLSAAATLRSLFYGDGEEAPTIETDLYGRRLIIRGSMEHITQIKQVLADLGEDGSGVRDRGAGGTVRRFALQGRSPEQFLKVLQQQWDSQQETKINIVIPNQSGPIRSLRTPSEVFEHSDDSAPLLIPQTLPEPANTVPEEADSPPLSSRLKSVTPGRWQQPTTRTLIGRISTSPESADSAATTDSSSSEVPPSDRAMNAGASFENRRWRTTAAQEQAASEQAADAESQAARGENKPEWDPNRSNRPAPAPSDSDVFVQPIGDELILMSNDEQKLDELEDLLDMLHQTLPMKPEYTVVYLDAADALEAADMLSQFFPSSSVASTTSTSGGSMLGSLGSSFGSMGSSLMDATGLSGLGSSSGLKIIPDVRTNSLFLTGPQSMIDDALVFLKVLNSNDIPESLKDMQPRQIFVKHADVNRVAALVRDVFKPYMEAAGGRQNNQQNPLAAMFGGGGGGSSGRGQSDDSRIRMTLGVDDQTSVLTVNSSLDIFNAVEEVVLQSDEAARLANPTVRSIQLKNADAVVIQQMLGSLMPRVTVSSSSTKPSTASSTPSGDNSSGDSNNAAQEAMNREIQNRMRERMQQGGGTSGASGGRSGAGGGRGGATGGFNPFGGGFNPFGGGSRPQGSSSRRGR
ncbi:MAG: hypothetical protein R3C59_19715 [Planctomycetaceae bacterium]